MIALFLVDFIVNYLQIINKIVNNFNKAGVTRKA
jgi:hypothetical protein